MDVRGVAKAWCHECLWHAEGRVTLRQLLRRAVAHSRRAGKDHSVAIRSLAVPPENGSSLSLYDDD